MGYFERRFVRPSHLQIVDALEEATREANEEHQVVDQDRDQWSAFVSEIRTEAEGVRQWYRAGQPYGDGVVGVAWWTDHLRRRHFRVWAGSSADGSFRRLFQSESHVRPPIWHIAPNHVFGRTREGRVDWLPVCACGMTGEARAIGWMGDRCGMCHYIPADAPGEEPVRLSSFAEAGAGMRRLAFSPNGRWLAGAGAGSNVHVWDVTAGLYHRAISPGYVEIRAVAFSPDSGLLAIAGGDRMLRFLDVAAGQEIAAYPTPNGVRSVVIAPDDLTLAIAASDGLEVWGRRAATLPWLPVVNYPMGAYCAAFHPSGDHLAAGGGGKLTLWSVRERGGEPVRTWAHNLGVEDFRGLMFTEAGTCVVTFEVIPTGGKRSVRRWEMDRCRGCPRDELFNLGGRMLRGAEYLASCLSPAGDWVASAEGNHITLESLWIAPWWYQLESHPGAELTALAFSPDGQTLASADEDGVVKLWPWRRLLDA